MIFVAFAKTGVRLSRRLRAEDSDMFRRIFRSPSCGAVLLGICLSIAGGWPPAEAQQIDGAGLADACSSCHGVDGHSQGSIPSIGGVDKAALLGALKAFKAQQGDATIMNRIARGYSDAELEALAAYYSSVGTK
jgi:sulfide dehydrogenase cytochrome subunit